MKYERRRNLRRKWKDGQRGLWCGRRHNGDDRQRNEEESCRHSCTEI